MWGWSFWGAAMSRFMGLKFATGSYYQLDGRIAVESGGGNGTLSDLPRIAGEHSWSKGSLS